MRHLLWAILLAIGLGILGQSPLYAQNAGEPRSYTVVAGDTLFEIAQSFDVTLEELIAYNGIIDPNLLERFQREAVVVSRLRHPNIVQIYDFDTVAGHPYIVMEHIAGPSLSRYLDALHAKGKRLDLPVISRLLTSVASALEYAHKMGVIHRDVKPANVMVTPEGRVKITDFGIATARFHGRLTRSG